MAEGFAAAVANSILAALLKGTNYTAPTAAWLKLHVGAPGASAASNAAAETTRKQITSSGTPTGGTATSSADLTWTAVAGSEDYTHFSVWDASTVGNFQFSGTITANPVVSGDTFTIAAGDFDVAIPIAS
jgi:hypothetical protein